MPSDTSELLATDLYEFVMMQAYAKAGLDDAAVFEFFVRRLPATRSFLMAAGLEQVLAFLETARFSERDLAVLAEHGHLDPGYLATLKDFRFAGDVDAMAEGTVFFANEPILRVTARIAQAQVVETRIINLLHFQTTIASRAARMVLASGGRDLVDFGLRRAHGLEAGLLAARASYIAGFAGTATTPAAELFGIPIFGTMAHSFVQVHDHEIDAFRNFAAAGPTRVVLLIDTYDIVQGAKRAVAVAKELAGSGVTLHGVRIDSGELVDGAAAVRRVLDDAGLHEVKIIASGGIDEATLQEFTRRGAPIDSAGIGTSLTTASDAPALDCAYKLQEYAGVARRKRSAGKVTLPGRKQVVRRFDGDGVMAGDTIGLADEVGDGLLQPVMRDGSRVGPAPSMARSRDLAAGQLAALPAAHQVLATDAAYEAVLSKGLRSLIAELERSGR